MSDDYDCLPHVGPTEHSSTTYLLVNLRETSVLSLGLFPTRQNRDNATTVLQCAVTTVVVAIGYAA